ncbi:MAG: hypothetical protein K8W52_03055 [Deltaproteobacteria bacterium]|nr:hypothetical protein [Deltaproteobacteria bacterium]
MAPNPAPTMRTSVQLPVEDDRDDLDWTLALAGGDGVRLRGAIADRAGAANPEPSWPLGAQSVLADTLDRMNQLTPASRTMTVIGTAHSAWAMPQLDGRSDHVFCQPGARDTAVALYVALAMIVRWHPNAIVTIVPIDHHVAPTARYLASVKAACAIAARHRDVVVLLGVEATAPDPELGYILPGDALADAHAVHEVAAFVAQPSPDDAIALQRAGALWNTRVACGSVAAFWELGRAANAGLLDTVEALVPLIGTEDEDDAIDYIYRARPPVSFARDICERATDHVVALSLTGVEWIDLGKAERTARARPQLAS